MGQNSDTLWLEWFAVLSELNGQSYPAVGQVFSSTVDGMVRQFKVVKEVRFHINSYSVADEIATHGIIPDESVLKFLKREYPCLGKGIPVGICRVSHDNPNGRRSHQCIWNGCLVHLGAYSYFDFDGGDKCLWLVEVSSS